LAAGILDAAENRAVADRGGQGTYVYPVFGSLPVQAIDTDLVVKAVEPIWIKKPETASRVRGRIEAVLDWATAKKFRRGENPARWKGHLDHLLAARSKVAAVEHHAALPYAELPGFMTELQQQEGVAARALEFAILTAARTGEVIGACWREIDFEARLWTVPAQRMKFRPGTTRAPQWASTGGFKGYAGDKERRLHLPRRQGGATAQQHGSADAAATNGARRSDRAWSSFDVLGLVRRKNRFSS
jgi:integrase